MAHRRACAPVRVGLPGPCPYHSRTSSPATVSKTEPTRGTSSSAAGNCAVLDPHPALDPGEHLLVTYGARQGRVLGDHGDASVLAAHVDELALRCVEPQARQRTAMPPSSSLSVGVRHSDSTGAAVSSGWTSSPSSSTSTAESGSAAEPTGVAALSRTCGTHTSVPRGAHASSSAVVTRSVSQASPPSSGSVNGIGTATDSPARTSGSSAAAVSVPPSARTAPTRRSAIQGPGSAGGW